MKKIVGISILVMTLAWTAAAENDTTVNRGLINLVAVGYDIEKNDKAQQMLRDMAQAARDAGAVGEIFLAGQDQDQLDQAMQQAMSIATRSDTPAPPEYRLKLKTPSVEPGHMIAVVHSDFTIKDVNAWIAFYEKSDDRDEDYISYAFLINLTDRVYDIKAPDKPGTEYHFRLFLSREYDCAARSDPLTISH